MALLEVDNIHTYYGNIHALKGVSLEVNEGEVVTLIGSNGAGKSTTLKTISGLLRLAGKDLTSHPAHEVAAMGLAQVPEGRRCFASLTVEENLDMGAFTRKDKPGIKQDLERMYDLFPRLRERRNQVSGTLSGGEQQMLAMGRALMARPTVLLMDEPSMGLAPVLVDGVFEIIDRLHKEGTTILLVEQNARMALQVADRGYVLQTGEIVKVGTGQDLQSDEAVQRIYLGIH